MQEIAKYKAHNLRQGLPTGTTSTAFSRARAGPCVWRPDAL